MEKKIEKIHISLISFTPKKIYEKECEDISECIPFLEPQNRTWIHVTGIHQENTIYTLGDRLKWHPLLQEDIMTSVQRPKLTDYGNNIYLVLSMLERSLTSKLVSEQVSVIFSDYYLISFSESKITDFCEVKSNLRKKESDFFKKGTDFLVYILMDTIVDHYFLVIERLDYSLEFLGKKVLSFTKPSILHEIQKIKREINLIRKQVWPLREIIHSFQKSESKLIQDKTKMYISDIYDHTIETIESLEGLRGLSDDMIEIYLSNVNHRTNQILTILTIVATVFVPLTFIASVYGMNFKYMPELEWKWGYPAVLMGMLLITIGMFTYFHKKKWL